MPEFHKCSITPLEHLFWNKKRCIDCCDITVNKLLLRDDDLLDLATNLFLSNASVDFILSSKSFGGPFM